MVFKWLGQPFGKKKQKTRQLWEGEFNVVNKGLDEEQVIAFVDDLIEKHKASQEASAASIRFIIQEAALNAQQVVDNIKLKAQEEAETERLRLIDQAKHEVEEIKRKAGIEAQKEAADILLAANKKAETSEVEAKQTALLFINKIRERVAEEVESDYTRVYSQLLSSINSLLSAGQDIQGELKGKRWHRGTIDTVIENILLGTAGQAAPAIETPLPVENEIAHDVAGTEKAGEQVQLQEASATIEAVETSSEPLGQQSPEKGEEQVQLQEASAPTEAVETSSESPGQQGMEEEPVTEATFVAVENDQSLYVGEIELHVAAPVDMKMMSKLYNTLQTTSQIKIIQTRGSREKGTVITLMLEKPTPLIALVSKVDGLEAKIEKPGTDDSVKRKGHFLPGRTGKKEIQRITLTYKSKGQHS